MANAFSELFSNKIDVDIQEDYDWTKSGDLKQKFIDAILKCNGNIDKLVETLYQNKTKKKTKFVADKYSEGLEEMKKTLQGKKKTVEVDEKEGQDRT